MKKVKILHVVGARPQFVKMALITDAAKALGSIESVVVHTGQHYDRNMSDVFFSQLKMPRPKYNLGIGSGPHTEQIGAMITALGKVLAKEAPDVVYVYGDTNSTLAGTIATTKLGIPLAHVEAGLRSFNRTMPEETNRIMTDAVSDILFCPTKTAVMNLRAEGVSKGVYYVEDVMLDMLIKYSKIASRDSKILDKIGMEKDGYYLATVHRSYNTDDIKRLKALAKIFSQLDKPVVFPIHPRTRKAFADNHIAIGKNIIDIEPVSYVDMLMLEMNASAILTDSGGVQKEAFFLGVPCVTLREETEWVETVESGWNVLAGVDERKIRKALQCISSRKVDRRDRNLPYSDMSSAKKMLKITIDHLRGKR
jgi:UDP-GlcNAc3NAcA epimerase